MSTNSIKLGPNVIAAIQRACGQSEAVQVMCAAVLEALGHTDPEDKFNLVIEARLEPAEKPAEG